jgi:hypothetical protein
MSSLVWIVLGLVAGFIGSKIVNKTEKEFSSISCWELLARSSGLAFQHFRRGWLDGATAFPVPQQ